MLRNCGKCLDFWNEESNTEPTPFFKWDCKEKNQRATCLDKKQGARCKKLKEEMWGIFLILLYNHSNLHATFKQKHHEVMVVCIIVNHFFLFNPIEPCCLALRRYQIAWRQLLRWSPPKMRSIMRWSWCLWNIMKQPPAPTTRIYWISGPYKGRSVFRRLWQTFNNVQRFKACEAQIPGPFIINKF